MDIKVFIASHEAKCGECGKEMPRHSWITLAGEKGPICLECADLDHLIYLPSGNAALTRRSVGERMAREWAAAGFDRAMSATAWADLSRRLPLEVAGITAELT